jgi:hypothetical protein
MAARPLLAGVGPNGEHLEGAGQWSPRIRSADPACGGAPGAKRRCMSTEVVGNSTTDAADHGQHVRVDPNSGTIAPSSTPQRLCLAIQPLTWSRIPTLANQSTGDPERPSRLQTAFEERATRIMAFSEGNYAPSTSPALLDVLTDEDIIIAVAAIEAVAARQPTVPSANAQKKLLAAVVADARGATKLLDKSAALTVGKRLHRQAERVRAELDDAHSAAAAARTRTREAAAADTAARATIRADLAAIDADEQLALERLQREVYVGFSELDELLPLPGDTADGLAATRIERARAAAEAAKEAEHEALCASLFESTVARLPDMPPALTLALGPDGVQALWQCAGEERCHLDAPADWCNVTDPMAPLACLVRKLVSEHREVEIYEEQISRNEKDLHSMDDLVDRFVNMNATMKRHIENQDRLVAATQAAAEEEVSELREALEKAKAREEALQSVIDRCMGGRAAGTSSGGV